METTRQQKIARMLQKELGEIFLLYARKLQGTLITVTAVRISPDLGIARTHLSIFPSEKAPAVLEQINADTKAIRFDLGKRVRFLVAHCSRTLFPCGRFFGLYREYR